MGKNVYRITENDLKEMILNTYKRAMNEGYDFNPIDEQNCVQDIMNGTIYGGNMSCNDEYGELQAEGESGEIYNIYVFITCRVEDGEIGYDVYDPGTEDFDITKIEIYKENGDSEEQVPYGQDNAFEDFIKSHMNVDFSDYEDWSGHKEPEDLDDYYDE